MKRNGLEVDRDRIPPAETDPEPSKADPSQGPARPEGRYPNWTALRWLFLFRLLIVVGLILNFSPANPTLSSTKSDPQWAWDILVVYGLLVLLSGFGLSMHRPRPENQVQIAIFIDILVFTLLMQAAGGITSGLGILLAVAVAAGALMLEGKLSLLFAALASIAVITQQLYALLASDQQTISFTHAGLLGLLFFAVALLSHVLYRRVRSAEELAARRQVDIDDLSKLNDFIIQSINTGILVADGDRHLRLMNQAARELLGVRRFRTGVALSKLSPELCHWLMERVSSNDPSDGSLHIGNRQINASLRLLGDYRASGVILYLRDTQEIAREIQQGKLASLGTLTASIAHNIRNPLSAITHASQLIAEDPSLSGDNHHLTEIIRRNGARIEETVQSILQLSRRQEIEPCPIDLEIWVQHFAAEFRESHALDEERCAIEPTKEAVRVEADARHLHQILANLAENSLIHGRLDGQPPRIRLRLRTDPQQGNPILELQDAGPGIDATTAKEIFNPFFTTKSQGTGLGLYIARELAESNGIRISHHPVAPHGSCFRLTFPPT
ncbi:sensor histidine kinase [Imhoffiella purpurea]|uniref:histidine kinase n=1 Tax=Imhoffiella purpurea TaxID=1249627 RepID=W9VGP5_9GAMM|nr:ATP-binding protein [Imhoffiella purpurea]EXJ15212.1 Two-component sensor PilS [Imhoffiella purpurea]